MMLNPEDEDVRISQANIISAGMKIIVENPTLQIVFCVDNSVCDNWEWSEHYLTSVCLSPWYEENGQIYDDADDIYQALSDRYEDKMALIEDDADKEKFLWKKYNEHVEYVIQFTTGPAGM